MHAMFRALELFFCSCRCESCEAYKEQQRTGVWYSLRKLLVWSLLRRFTWLQTWQHAGTLSGHVCTRDCSFFFFFQSQLGPGDPALCWNLWHVPLTLSLHCSSNLTGCQSGFILTLQLLLLIPLSAVRTLNRSEEERETQIHLKHRRTD